MSKPLPEAVRVDAWIWAVRVFKTRAASRQACVAGKVEVDGEQAKPARRVRAGDEVTVRLKDHTRILVVVQTLEKRVGPAVAVEAYEDRSPPKPERPPKDLIGPIGEERARGAGRPTKRERREIDRLRGRGRG